MPSLRYTLRRWYSTVFGLRNRAAAVSLVVRPSARLSAICFTPLGRAFYGFSTLLCTPASLSQEVGLALGAQAGEARIHGVITIAGLTRFRRATETPVNAVYEARP